MKNRRPTITIITAGILGLTLLGLAPLTAQARGRGGRPPSPEQAVERLAEQLDLTEEQRLDVESIIEESFEQRREMRDQHHQEREAMRDATDERLSAILTGKQMDELRELREARQERRRDRNCRKERWDGERAEAE